MRDVDAVYQPQPTPSTSPNLRTQPTGSSAEIVGVELVLRISLIAKPEKSASRTTLVATYTHGNKVTDCMVNGTKVPVGINAYCPVE